MFNNMDNNQFNNMDNNQFSNTDNNQNFSNNLNNMNTNNELNSNLSSSSNDNANDFSTDYETQSQTSNALDATSFNTNDIPPDLPKIDNLSDATITNAPTLDVLGPMNVMPENLPLQSNDPLDVYESGNLDISNNSNFNNGSLLQQPGINNVDELNQNQFSKPLENQSSSNPILNMHDNFNNGSVPNMQNNITFDSLSSNTFNNPDITANINSPLNTKQNVNPYDNQNLINNSLSFEGNTSIDDVFLKHDIKENNDNLNSIESSLPETSFISEQQPLDLSHEDSVSKAMNTTIGNESNDIQEQENSNLTDLGLDDSYTEPDVLEIMDFDKEEPQDIPSSSNSNEVQENVGKIKELINELKSNGANIELEEFDFEAMYQLIIKFDK